jgi:hypothetical protein
MSIAIYRQTIQKSGGQERKNRLQKKNKMKANKLATVNNLS